MRWKDLRYRTEKVALDLATQLVPLLPRSGCLALARWLGNAFFHLDPKGRAVALANLEVAFGNRYSPAERKRIARASLANFAQTFLDLFWGAKRLNHANFPHWIHGRGTENAPPIDGKPPGTIFLCAHYGNWEWMGYWGALGGRKHRTIAQEFKNPLIGPIFDALRTAHGSTVMEREGAMRRTLKFLKGGGEIAIVVDLSLRPSSDAVAVDCFGMKCSLSRIPAAFHKRFGCALVPAAGIPSPDGTFTVEMSPALQFSPAATEREIAQACWNITEQRIRERPELWLWAYKHFRYRPSDTTVAYPFYANTSRAFDKLLAET